MSVGTCFSQTWQESIPRDKQQHFAVGLAVAGMTYISAYDYYHQKNPKTAHSKATKVTMGVNIAMALAKEIYDNTSAKLNHTWTPNIIHDSYGDILATVLGGASLTLIIRLGADK